METMDSAARDAAELAAQRRLPPAWLTRTLCVLWPAFMMAAVLEWLVFAWIDPAGLVETHADAAIAVHSLAFLLFWAVIALAIGLSRLLSAPAQPASSADVHAVI